MIQSRKTLSEEARKHVLNLLAEHLSRGNRRLPTARRMAADVEVSYATMRLVLAELEKDGYIQQIQGSGTYITPQTEELLRAEQTRHLVFFRPPHFGTPENSYNEWLAVNLEKHAPSDWKLTTVMVASHDEFLKNAQAMLSAADAIAYAPVGEVFTLNQIAELKKLQSKPLVLFNEFPNTSIYNITVDNRRGGAMAASCLLSANHRRIALLYSEPLIEPCRNRAQGFIECLELAGLEPVVIDCQVGRDDNRYDCAFRAMTAALERGLDVTAVFAVSDYGAWGAMDAIRQAGLRIPEDLSLIGFDGLPFTDRLVPRLTTIRQPMEHITENLFRILDGRNRDGQYKISLSPSVKTGDSVLVRPLDARDAGPFGTNPFRVLSVNPDNHQSNLIWSN